MIARGVGSNMIRRLGPRAAIDTVSHQGSVLVQYSLLDADVFCLNLTPLPLRCLSGLDSCMLQPFCIVSCLGLNLGLVGNCFFRQLTDSPSSTFDREQKAKERETKNERSKFGLPPIPKHEPCFHRSQLSNLASLYPNGVPSRFFLESGTEGQHRVRIETESDRWRTVTGMWETSTDTSATLIPK